MLQRPQRRGVLGGHLSLGTGDAGDKRASVRSVALCLCAANRSSPSPSFSAFTLLIDGWIDRVIDRWIDKQLDK